MKNNPTKTGTLCLSSNHSLLCKFFLLPFILLLLTTTIFAQRTASVSGNWNSTATWGGSSVPSSSDAVTINAGITVTVDVAANAASVTANGTLNLTNASFNLTIANSGFVTINSGGSVVFNSTAVINGGGNGNGGITLTINSGAGITTANTAGFTVPGSNGNGTNGFTMNKGNKTWTYNAGANYTFNGSGAQVTGAAITAANNLTVNNSAGLSLSANTTVSGTLGLSAGTITVGAHTLTFSGTSVTRTSGNIDASNASAIISFTNTSAVSLPASAFTGTITDIRSNSTGGVSLGSASTITTLTIGDVTSNSIFSDGGGQITSTGTLNLTSGTFMLGAGSATTFPAFATQNISAGTFIEYAASPSQTVSITPAYQNLTFSGGTKTVGSGTLSIAGNWAVGSHAVLSTNNPTVTVTGNITGAGDITMGSSTINIAGNWTNNGNFTKGSGTLNYTKLTGGQTLGGLSYNNLTLSNTSGTNSAGGNMSVSGTLTVTSGGILDMTAAYTLGGSISSVANGGTIKTSVPTSTSNTPLASGITWNGIIEYAAAAGSQTVVAGTYTNLILSNTSGTNSAGGAITINGTLTQSNASAILDMVTYALSGTITPSITGTIQTQNTSAAPIPTGKTWGGIIKYNASSGGQTIMAGTYATLTLSNTSGTSTASGALATTTLNTTAGGILDMVTFALTATTISHAGILITQNTSATPIPSGKTWGGTAEYNGTGSQTVVAGTYNNLTMSASGGKSISGNVTVTGALTLTNGILTSTAVNLLTFNAGATSSASSNTSFVNGPIRKIFNAAESFTFPVGVSGTGDEPLGIGTATAGDDFTAEYKRVSAKSLDPDVTSPVLQISACDHWTLTKNSVGATSVSVTISWDAASSCNATTFITDPSGLTVAHYNGASWDQAGTGGTSFTGNASAGSVTRTAVSVFSPFALGNTAQGQNPLPVRLGNLKATRQTNDIRIDWTNYTESEVDHYSVERSSDGIQFSSIGQVAAGLNNGGRADYNFLDISPAAGTNFYRIKSVENNNKLTYSPVVRVNAISGFTGINIYPNPVKGSVLVIQASNLPVGLYHLKVFSNTGQLVLDQPFNCNGASVSQSIQLPASVKPGIYSLILKNEEKTLQKTFMVQ